MQATTDFERLRGRLTDLCDLRSVGGLLSWDQETMMPVLGAPARANQTGTVARLCHEMLIDPEVGQLLEKVARYEEEYDSDSDELRLFRRIRHEYDKAILVPAELVGEISYSAAQSQEVWRRARVADDFRILRDNLKRQIELAQRYCACFNGFSHPYDALLDDYEPDLTVSTVKSVFSDLRNSLVELVEASQKADTEQENVFAGKFPVDAQREAVLSVLSYLGFDPKAWRLDPTEHPFAGSLSVTDVRMTTKYDEHDFSVAFYSVLHEFGHALYESAVDPRYERTFLRDVISMGMHESQSRTWENIIGRSKPFCKWVLPQITKYLPTLSEISTDQMYRSVNQVTPSLIRIFADETTYNLHIILRFELELALIEGTLAVEDLPEAWNQKMYTLLGVEVPNDADGVLQDIHWAAGLFGYFPTYTLGNLISAQLWQQIEKDLKGDLHSSIERGEFGLLRDWMRENIHRFGSKYSSNEILHRITGKELSAEPLISYLSTKLKDAGIVA